MTTTRTTRTTRLINVKAWYASEDWFTVWLGLLIVGLSLPAAFGVDLLGWMAAPQVWLEFGKAAQPVLLGVLLWMSTTYFPIPAQEKKASSEKIAETRGSKRQSESH